MRRPTQQRKAKVSAEDQALIDADQNERTTPFGLYNYACSYRAAGEALSHSRLRTPHHEAPHSYLYFHAIELFLKAYLRNKGYTVKQLLNLRHHFGKLRDAFVTKGGHLDDEDKGVLELMASTDVVIRSRYIITGAFTTPTVDALERTAKSLHKTVRDAFKAAGLPAR